MKTPKTTEPFLSSSVIPMETPKGGKPNIILDNISFSGENEDTDSYKDSQKKENISNLIDISLNKSNDLLKLDNITPIKSIVDESSTKKGNNQRYLHCELDELSLNDNEDIEVKKIHDNPNVNFDSPSNSSFSGLNSFNLFNLSIQSPKNKISFLTKKIENYDIFIYDSFLLKKIFKENSLSKKEIGQLYTSLTSSHFKQQILTEMIGRLSKRHLKKKLNQLENDSHLEKIIVEIFNIFLGQNKKNEILYSKTLPGELNDVFGIDIILDLKKEISIANLFIIMEYHNKVYFNDNININFRNEYPFISQDIKYISPYLIDKVYQSVSHDTNHSSLNLTSIKRLPNLLSSTSPALKEFHNNNDISRIELLNSIYSFIPNKKYEICAKLCDYYMIKFSDTFFLNSMVYMPLAEIYNTTLGIDAARNFFMKAIEVLKWLYPEDNCPLICDAYYSYSLLLMKQGDSFITNNFKEIKGIINKALILGRDFYERNNREKFLKIKLNYYLFQCSYEENRDNEDGLMWNNIVSDLEEMYSIARIEGETYVSIFIDLIKRDRKKRGVMQRLRKIII